MYIQLTNLHITDETPARVDECPGKNVDFCIEMFGLCTKMFDFGICIEYIGSCSAGAS